jgi:Fe-S-cluster-containing hydrogenase component 2
MFQTSMKVRIIDEACIGCKRCVSVCPSGALEMQGKLAVLEESRCVGCMKCAEQCIPYQAIEMLPDTSPRTLGIPREEWDMDAVTGLCAGARLDPEQTICVCTGTTAGEVAAAVAQGIHEPEDIVDKTGVRALCGWLCLTPIMRLLEAQGVELGRPDKDYRIYEQGTKVAIWNISDEVDAKYPEYRLKESREAIEAGTLTEPTPWFADILPAKENA